MAHFTYEDLSAELQKGWGFERQGIDTAWMLDLLKGTPDKLTLGTLLRIARFLSSIDAGIARLANKATRSDAEPKPRHHEADAMLKVLKVHQKAAADRDDKEQLEHRTRYSPSSPRGQERDHKLSIDSLSELDRRDAEGFHLTGLSAEEAP